MNEVTRSRRILILTALFIFLSFSYHRLVPAQDAQAVQETQDQAHEEAFGDEARFESFKEELDRVKAEADSVVSKVKHLKERDELVSALEEKLAAALEKEKEFIYKLVEANKDIIHLKKQTGLLEKDLVLFKKEMELKESLVKSEARERATVLKDNEDLRLDAKRARSERDELTLVIGQMKQEVVSLNKEIDFLKRDLQLKSKQSDQSEQLVEAKTAAMTQAVQELAAAQLNEKAMLAKLTQTEYEVESLNQVIASLKNDIAIRDKQIIDTKRLLDEEKAASFIREGKLQELNRKEGDIAFERKQAAQEIASLTKDVSILKKNITAKDEQIKKNAKLVGEKSALAFELVEAKKDRAALDDSIDFVNKQLAEKGRALKETQRQLAEKEA
ncbi:hypothetical protein ACFL5X_04300, partial [Candidatus Omnitrophota bacterium]